MKKISISNALTILEIIGEEDSIGFEHDDAMQDALSHVADAIQARIDSGAISALDTLVEFH